MKFFIDTANMNEITKWMDMGVIDGVTTNPSIMLKDGIYDVDAGGKKIAKLVSPMPVSLEVTTDDLPKMLVQARKLAKIASNVVVKIPQITRTGVPCYGVIRQLEKEGIKVNATVAMSFGQVMLAAKAGATYISIFAGRVGDEGGDPAELISNATSWLEHWDYTSEIIVGSIRSVADVWSAALAGAHIITVPPQFLNLLADHKNSRATVEQFLNDANKALKMMNEPGKKK
jgi:transaldolase